MQEQVCLKQKLFFLLLLIIMHYIPIKDFHHLHYFPIKDFLHLQVGRLRDPLLKLRLGTYLTVFFHIYSVHLDYQCPLTLIYVLLQFLQLLRLACLLRSRIMRKNWQSCWKNKLFKGKKVHKCVCVGISFFNHLFFFLFSSQKSSVDTFNQNSEKKVNTAIS